MIITESLAILVLFSDTSNKKLNLDFSLILKFIVLLHFLGTGQKFDICDE